VEKRIKKRFDLDLSGEYKQIPYSNLEKEFLEKELEKVSLGCLNMQEFEVGYSMMYFAMVEIFILVAFSLLGAEVFEWEDYSYLFSVPFLLIKFN